MILSGFSCPSCNFRLLLCDSRVSWRIVKCFREGASSVSIACPECGQEHRYTYFDLKAFSTAIEETAIAGEAFSHQAVE